MCRKIQNQTFGFNRLLPLSDTRTHPVRVAGGGDTVSLLNDLNAVKEFNFVSTAGGAFLEFLEGKNLPGITALN